MYRLLPQDKPGAFLEICLFSAKNDKNTIKPETYGNRLSQPFEFAEAFAAHFKSAFDNHCMRDFSTDFRSSDSMTIASASDSDVHNTRAPMPIKTFWT